MFMFVCLYSFLSLFVSISLFPSLPFSHHPTFTYIHAHTHTHTLTHMLTCKVPLHSLKAVYVAPSVEGCRLAPRVGLISASACRWTSRQCLRSVLASRSASDPFVQFVSVHCPYTSHKWNGRFACRTDGSCSVECKIVSLCTCLNACTTPCTCTCTCIMGHGALLYHIMPSRRTPLPQGVHN